MAKPKGLPKTGGRKKGSSNRVGKDIRVLAQTHTEKAIKTLADIMKDTKAPPQARAMAADKLLDRGWGKAPQTIAGDPENPLQLAAAIEFVIVDPQGQR